MSSWGVTLKQINYIVSDHPRSPTIKRRHTCVQLLLSTFFFWDYLNVGTLFYLNKIEENAFTSIFITIHRSKLFMMSYSFIAPYLYKNIEYRSTKCEIINYHYVTCTFEISIDSHQMQSRFIQPHTLMTPENKRSFACDYSCCSNFQL